MALRLIHKNKYASLDEFLICDKLVTIYMIVSSTHCYLKMLEISELLLDDSLCEIYSIVGIYHKQTRDEATFI